MSSAARTKPKKLATRLAYANVGLFSGVLLLLSAVVFAAAYMHLTQTHAENLRGTALLISDHLADEYNEGEDLSRNGLLSDLNTNWDLNLIVRDASGRTVNALRNYYFDEGPLSDADENIRLKMVRGLLLMYAKVPIGLDGANPASLLLVLNLQTEMDFLTLIAVLLLCMNAAGILAAAVFSRKTAKRMLAPVEGMISAASAIDSANLKCRLEVPESYEELRALALTVNSMLDRVENAFRLQGQFAADASHELRTPLSVIQGYIDLLIRWGGTDPAVLAEAVAALDHQTQYMNRLVNNLLLIARLESGQNGINREEFDVSELFKELMAEQGVLDAEHEYAVEGPDSCPLFADRSMVRQLLRILLDNAAKYTPPGGTITLSCAKSPKKTALSVADTGIGMDPEDLTHAFERFYRADKARSRATGGMGLGLSIARSIVESHGGTVFARARSGGSGTVIEIAFPNPE